MSENEQFPSNLVADEFTLESGFVSKVIPPIICSILASTVIKTKSPSIFRNNDNVGVTVFVCM